jgi:hypothetical protein
LRDAQIAATLYQNGQLFYIPNDNKFYKLSVSGAVYTLVEQTGTSSTDLYTAKFGRQDIYFQYRHNSPNNRRIDPSPNNIIDLYILTKQYATDYVAWIQDSSNTIEEPELPTGDELGLEFSELEKYKSISDTLIYNPAKFKPIFGIKADPVLQATFKVVKNASVVVSDNDIKTSVIAAINSYFDVNNWDFGETFYFTEMAAYIHTKLVGQLSQITIYPINAATTASTSLFEIPASSDEMFVPVLTTSNIVIVNSINSNNTLSNTGVYNR